MGTKGNYGKVCIVCECGVKICGNSDSNAKANLRTHKKSKLHKNQTLGNQIFKEKNGDEK